MALLGLVVASVAVWSNCVDGDAMDQLNAAIVDTCNSIPDGAYCDDRNACTRDDRCVGGMCVGLPAVDGTPCTDGNLCTLNDACMTGVCTGAPAPDGTACTDGDPCTDPDVCSAGQCASGGLKSLHRRDRLHDG